MQFSITGTPGCDPSLYSLAVFFYPVALLIQTRTTVPLRWPWLPLSSVFLALDAFGAQPSYRIDSEYLTPGRAKLFLNDGANEQGGSVQVNLRSIFSVTPVMLVGLHHGDMKVALLGDD